MTLRVVFGVVVVSLVSSCAGGGNAPPAPPCTLLPCSDSVSITAQLTAEQARAGQHVFSVTSDAATVRCELAHTDAASRADAQCVGSVSLSLGPRMETVEVPSPVPGTVMITERAVPGVFEWRAEVYGQPASVRVVHELDGVVLRDQTAAPTYTATRPNGPACDPECHTAAVTWPAS